MLLMNLPQSHGQRLWTQHRRWQQRQRCVVAKSAGTEQEEQWCFCQDLRASRFRLLSVQVRGNDETRYKVDPPMRSPRKRDKAISLSTRLLRYCLPIHCGVYLHPQHPSTSPRGIGVCTYGTTHLSSSTHPPVRDFALPSSLLFGLVWFHASEQCLSFHFTPATLPSSVPRPTAYRPCPRLEQARRCNYWV